MITINQNFKINTDGNGCTLIHTVSKSRIDKETNLPKDYKTDQEYHFMTVEQCLNKYLDLVVEPCLDVIHVLAAIQQGRLEIKTACEKEALKK